jgi:hypothetical protein
LQCQNTTPRAEEDVARRWLAGGWILDVEHLAEPELLPERVARVQREGVMRDGDQHVDVVGRLELRDFAVRGQIRHRLAQRRVERQVELPEVEEEDQLCPASNAGVPQPNKWSSGRRQSPSLAG